MGGEEEEETTLGDSQVVLFTLVRFKANETTQIYALAKSALLSNNKASNALGIVGPQCVAVCSVIC